ncbi:MAG TPA: hypothetical protein PLG59_19380 [bacterium]|nr:hypothetical protein [bacterium]HQQ01034.1 hypothetical protein [bacterium]
MIIPINREWRIKSTEHSWDAQKLTSKNHRRSKADSDAQWITMAYCSTLTHAFRWVYQRRVRGIESDIPEKIMEQMQAIEEEMRAVLRRFDELDVRHPADLCRQPGAANSVQVLQSPGRKENAAMKAG